MLFRSSLLEGKINIINNELGLDSGHSAGSGADILSKLSALGDTPLFKDRMNDRTLIDVVGILNSNAIANNWNNKTILDTIGDPTKLPGSTDITTELQHLGSLNDYSSNTLISKIGNISSITTTLKDIIDALGNITATYNSGSTLLNDLYTKSQVDTIITDLIGTAPDALNTLKELADALNNDHEFSVTITTQLTTINNSIDIINNNIGNVENVALSTWPGSTNITNLGTITTGTWQGNPINIDKINWVNKTSLNELESTLPSASHIGLIASVANSDLYFSDGSNYIRLSNYDDVTTSLSGKQDTITFGSLSLNSINGLTVTVEKLNTLTDADPSKGTIQTQIENEINRATNAEVDINNKLDIIGSLNDYSSPNNTLLSNIGNLNEIPGSLTLIDYLKNIGNISNYSSSNTLSANLGNLHSSTISVKESLDKLGDLSSYNNVDTVLNNIYVKNEVDTLIGNKQDTITGAVSDLTTNNLTAGRAVVSNGSGKIVVSAVTDTQIGYLSNVTSDIQSQIADIESTLTINLNNEITRATGAETVNTTAINNEVSRATGAENTLTTNLNNEITRATGVEGTLSNLNTTDKASLVNAVNENVASISSETTRATGAENTLTTNLNNEITRATGVEGTLSNLNTTDKASLVNAVNENVASISSETTRATNAENTLTTNLNNEITRATGVEGTLSNLNTTDKASLVNAVRSEEHTSEL